jgi:hypothetical protein
MEDDAAVEVLPDLTEETVEDEVSLLMEDLLNWEFMSSI